MSEQDQEIPAADVLAAINSAMPTEPLPAPEPMTAVEFPPEAALPPPEPVAEAAPEPAPVPSEETVMMRPASSRAIPAPMPAWFRHRHEAAGLVTAFVAIVWIAVGVAMGAWSPALLGVLFAGGAACIKAYAPPI